MASNAAIEGSGPRPQSLSGSRFLSRRADDWLDRVAANPWAGHAGLHLATPTQTRPPLYTAEQRRRRDSTPWTLVQGLLAPAQFLACLVSVALVLRYLATGEGAGAAVASVFVKTALLYAIMITGSVWEKVVFDKWLFAPAFFWEDVFSMLVLALHTAYVAAVLLHIGTPTEQLLIALAAYAAYAVNAAQFLLKLRAARLEAPQAQARARA